ncbi:MAG: FkbM family methyltransferase [Deltaproteobacteria bacterium]
MCLGLFFDGCQPHESGTEKLFRRIIKDGDVVVDVGANVGYYTRMASRLVRGGFVLAFEPMPAAYRLLEMNSSDLSNVTLFPIALSDRAGDATFYIRKNGDTSSLNPDSGAKAVQVQTSTADDMLMKYSRIDFMKIDVEGFELEVLHGAKAILSKYRPIVCFELLEGYAKEKNIGLEDFKALFSKLDYCLKWIDHSDTEINLVSDNPSNMVVAIPSERMQLFK